jgi:hypothetical protein
MVRDLTSSSCDRQNILNNPYAIDKIAEHLNLQGTYYEDRILFTKQQLVQLFEISDSTIEKYLATHGNELKSNGYLVLKGKRLQQFKAVYSGTVIDYGTKTTVLGVFTFRALLNLAMLLTESERAREIRSRILDIVIDVVAEKAGGHTKYINQRDRDYLPAAYQEFSYRQEFTNALNRYVEMGKGKFGFYTDKIYQFVFKENTREYKQILKLHERDTARETMYSEVLKAIASIENGLAREIEIKSNQLGRQLKPEEVNDLIQSAEYNPYLEPIIQDARVKMASRDLGFRDALHHKLEAYIQSVPENDFERFLGETSKSLEEQLSDPETMAVFKRLKDR